MQALDQKTRTSFPVTIWYDEVTGEIQIARPSDTKFMTSISHDGRLAHGHPYLFAKLTKVLRDAGADCPQVQNGRNGI